MVNGKEKKNPPQYKVSLQIFSNSFFLRYPLFGRRFDKREGSSLNGNEGKEDWNLRYNLRG